MKNFSFSALLFLILSGLCLTACNRPLVNDSTPYISRSGLILNPTFSGDTITGGQDTLTVTAVESSTNVFAVQSIAVGDSVVMAVVFGALTNQLVSATVSSDAPEVLSVRCQLNESVQQTLSSQSDVSKGQLVFNSGWESIGFPVYLRAQKAGSATVTFHVVTDSQYSPVTAYLRFTVTD